MSSVAAERSVKMAIVERWFFTVIAGARLA